MDKTSRIAIFGGEPSWMKSLDLDQSGGEADSVILAGRVHRAIDKSLDDFQIAAAKINESEDFTEVGKKRALARLAEETRKGLGKHQVPLAQIRRRRDSTKDKLKLEHAYSGDKVAGFLAEHEIRSFLPRDQLKLFEAYCDALIAGDVLTATAIANTPRSAPHALTEEQIAEGRATMFGQKLPAESQEVAELEEALGSVDKLLGDVEDFVSVEGGLSTPKLRMNAATMPGENMPHSIGDDTDSAEDTDRADFAAAAGTGD